MLSCCNRILSEIHFVLVFNGASYIHLHVLYMRLLFIKKFSPETIFGGAVMSISFAVPSFS